jgi:hypothetical protein
VAAYVDVEVVTQLLPLNVPPLGQE